MFPPAFDYRRASSVEEALELLVEHGDDARVLAGGQSLLPELKTGDRTSAPGVLVDVGEVDELGSIESGDDETTVGALVRYVDVVDSEALGTRARGFVDAARAVGDVQVRNRGTVGGNLAQADPEGDLPAAALAADATLEARGPDGERTVEATDFFRGSNETALETGELLTAVRLPRERGRGSAYVRKTHPASGYAMVGVAAALEVDGGKIVHARVACTGVAERATRLERVEEAILGGPAGEDSFEAAAERAGEDLESVHLVSDPHASGEFRAHLLASYVERALERAAARAADGATAAAGGESR